MSDLKIILRRGKKETKHCQRFDDGYEQFKIGSCSVRLVKRRTNQEELARRLKTRKTAISRIETMQRYQVVHLERVAGALGNAYKSVLPKNKFHSGVIHKTLAVSIRISECRLNGKRS